MSHSATLIVIEDEAQIRRFLRTSLVAEGYQVIEAETGRQGLLEAANRKPDMLILDLGLPDMDGVNVVREIRAWSTVPIIILSARSQEFDKISALDAGADDYLVKPFRGSKPKSTKFSEWLIINFTNGNLIHFECLPAITPCRKTGVLRQGLMSTRNYAA
jgi:CheY-like chemotaxis protein